MNDSEVHKAGAVRNVSLGYYRAPSQVRSSEHGIEGTDERDVSTQINPRCVSFLIFRKPAGRVLVSCTTPPPSHCLSFWGSLFDVPQGKKSSQEVGGWE